MKYDPGNLVFLRNSPGVFTVESYDSAKNRVRLKGSLPGLIEEPEENVVRVSDDGVEDIRCRAISNSLILEGDIRPVSPFTPEETEFAKSREVLMIRLIEEEITLDEAKVLMGLGATMVRKLRNEYLVHKSWTVFIRKKSGRPKGETQFSTVVEELIVELAKDYTGPGANEQRVIDTIITICNDKVGVAPSPSTIRRRLRVILTERDRVKIKKGNEAAADEFGSYPFGMIPSAPLEIVEADGSPLDLHVRCKHTGRVLGRPYLMLVKDKFTKAYLGFALYFGAPSRWTLAQAIEMAIKPKDEVLRALGLDETYQWIQYGRFSVLLVDGGPDLNANTVKAACALHGVKHKRRRRKQSGGSIERGLGIILRYYIQTLEGAVPSSGKKPRGKKVQDSALYSLDDAYKLVVTEICRRHEKVGSDGLTPNQRWTNAYGKHDGVITTPPRFEDPLAFVIEMYHEHRVTVRREGIVVIGLLYEPGPYFNKSKTRVRVKIDNSDIDRAWVEHEKKWVPIKRLGLDLDNLRPYKYGPISMLVYKAYKYSQPRPGSLTAAGEGVHLSQRALKKQIEIEARDRARNIANGLQADAVGAFAQSPIRPVPHRDEELGDFDEAEVEPLKGIFI
ncbi:hypothetical protein [Pseudomonas fluorescens]|uniref:hypothetical protein n=1 Tax=Pseudomonas fluorescens TaxID=294 RepID=UPI00058A745C|nr:hypothetical protein [Pseudomonas fluorescens]CEL29235.1 Integrase core domain protein [Pseudomonas fluorescens]